VVKLIAGKHADQTGPIASPTTRPFIADVILEAEGSVTLDIPADHAGFVYVYDGAVEIDKTLIERTTAGVLNGQGPLTLTSGALPSRALVVTGMPLKEPIVRHGPFVMNTVPEIHQAIADFQRGLFD
jgi:quercetin 2,3-dioxygenase